MPTGMHIYTFAFELIHRLQAQGHTQGTRTPSLAQLVTDPVAYMLDME